MAHRLGADSGGVSIQHVAPGSPAASSGVRAGDVIVDVDGAKVGSVEDFERALTRTDAAGGVRLHVRNRDRSRFVFLKEQRAA